MKKRIILIIKKEKRFKINIKFIVLMFFRRVSMKYKVEVVMPKNPQKLLDKFADVLAEEVAKALTREELIIYAKRLEEQIIN